MIPHIPVIPITVPFVPFYSQFTNITSPAWKKVSCGIASLAMVIEYYEPNSVSVDTLLTEALASGAYDKNAGWIHKKLINLSGKYGLEGNSYDVTKLSKEKAYASLESHLKGGPVIVSVHYKFDPKSTIPHLVVIDGVDKDTLYYNDPAAKSGEKQISKALFLKAWKSKFIVIRPVVIKNKTT